MCVFCIMRFCMCEIVGVCERESECVCVCVTEKGCECVSVGRVHVYMKESERKSVYFLFRVFLYV